MLRSDLCDYSDACTVVKEDIIVAKTIFTAADFDRPNNTNLNAINTNNANNNAFGEKKVVFKNNAPFIYCISKINGVKIDNAEDLDVVMPMYNLLEYSKNCKKTTDSLSNYYRDGPSSGTDDNNIIQSILNSESFDYKANFMKNGVTQNNLTKNDVKIVVPLTHLTNFWRSLNISLINCKVELILTWFKNCMLIDKSTRDANYNTDPQVSEINNPENAAFQITDTNLYLPVVTLSRENDTKHFEQLKLGFKKTINGTNMNNNLNYLIDPTFININRLFVLTFPRYNNTDSRYSYSNYYVPNVKINDFNVLIDRKSLFDLPVKNEEEAYQKMIKMSNNNDYRTGNLLDFAYFKKNYKLIATDLSKQTKSKDPQQINFTGKLSKNTGATMFFIIEKSEEITFIFLQNSFTTI